jgi:hypothetical protein
MPREPIVIDNFAMQMNNKADAEDLLPNEMSFIRNMIGDIPGQLRTAGEESANLKTLTGIETEPGTSLFNISVDRNLAGTEQETEWLLIGDKDTGNIGILEYLAGTEGSGAISGGSWNASQIQPGKGASNFIMSVYGYDGAIRACDSNFGGTPRWFGYIKRTWFPGATPTAFDNYYALTGGLPSVTDESWVFLARDHDDTHTYATSNIKCQLKFHDDPEKPNYQWKKKFQMACSIVYDEVQESLLTIGTKIIDGETSGVSNPSRAAFFLSVGSNFGTAFNKRATHIKIYMREVGTENWFLQATFDLNKGGTLPHADDYQAWTADTGHHLAYNVDSADTDAWMDAPSTIYTYQVETGHDPDIAYLDFARVGEGWKSACVVGRTVYLGNVRRTGEHGGLEIHGDALWKSLPNQPDKFIPINMNVAVSDDGDNIIKALAGNGVVYEFKKKTMRVIDVSHEIENVVGTFVGEGGILKEGHAVSTPSGPIWVNRYGLFTLDSRGLQELFERPAKDKSTRPSMDLSWWNAGPYAAGSCCIQYDPSRRQLFMHDYDDDGIIFDVPTKSWTYIYNRVAILSSNIILDSLGNIVFIKDAGANSEIHVFDFDSASSTTNLFTTGEISLGGPKGIAKYVYHVIIKYKHSHATTLRDNIKLIRDGEAETLRLDGQMVQSTEWAYAKFVMPSSALYQIVDTAKFEIGGYDFNGSTEATVDTILNVAFLSIDKRIIPAYRTL